MATNVAPLIVDIVQRPQNLTPERLWCDSLIGILAIGNWQRQLAICIRHLAIGIWQPAKSAQSATLPTRLNTTFAIFAI